MKRFIAIALGVFLVFVASGSLAENRTALVIGNDKYRHLPALNNAGRDARDMAAKLKKLGFDVIESFNGGERDMGRAIGRFAEKLSRGGTGLVFYAGHGVQAHGKNYLIPVDAELEDEGDLQFGAISTDTLLTAMRDAGNELNIIIMDACRDNPLPKRSRSSSRGLAITQMPEGAKGTAILYAAGPGQTAADGDKGRNGTFTGALLRHMDNPGWTLEQVFKATARDVLAKTGNKQRPWQQVSMQGDFHFRAKPKDTVVADNNVTRTVDPKIKIIEKDSGATDIALWRAVQNSNDPAMFQAYLNKFPNGTFAEIAKIRLATLQGKTKKTPTKKTNSELVAVDADYVTLRSANVRLKPDVSGAKLTTLPSGVRVRVKSKTPDGKWMHVARNGQIIGYIYNTLLRSQESLDNERKKIEERRSTADRKRRAEEERRRKLAAVRTKDDEARRRREQARRSEAERKRRAEEERRKQSNLKSQRVPRAVDSSLSGKQALNLAWKYYSGTGGVGKNHSLAARYFYHGANRGNAQSMHGMGWMYEKGLGVQKNIGNAFYWYKRSVDSGYALAHSNLGHMYEKGRGVKRNYSEAARLYRRGANKGNPRSQNNLGSLYERGLGVTKSRSEALYWYRKAAKKGDKFGKRNLARLQGGGGSNNNNQNRNKAGIDTSLSSSKSVKRADDYYHGRNGYRKDYATAMRYYRQAANRGNALGQANVGWMYRKGFGVKQDFSQALYWYRKASKKGNPTAANNIGVMYERGLGVRKSQSEAIFWYRKAAARGNKRAKKNLSRLGY